MATNESYENLTDEPESVEQSVDKKGRGRPKGNVANLTPFNSETAKKMALKAAYAKKCRAEMRRRILAKVCEAGIDECVAKALKTSDKELMDICVAATKLTGLDFGSSEEAVQNLNVKADVDSKVSADTTLHVTIEDVGGE
jgi:hypothetical protein